MSAALAAQSEVVIANMALSRIKVSQRIASFDDPGPASSNCGFWYPICRDRMLKYAPWDFARSSVALATDPTTTFPGWKYAYQFPSNCIHAVAVMTAHGMRFGPEWWVGAFWPGLYSNFAIPKIPFQVIQNATGTGRTIVTDIPNAYLYFIATVTLPTLFDAMFTDALAWDVAKEVSGPMRADPQWSKLATQMAKSTLLEAMSQMMNQAQQDPERDSPSILVRG